MMRNVRRFVISLLLLVTGCDQLFPTPQSKEGPPPQIVRLVFDNAGQIKISDATVELKQTRAADPLEDVCPCGCQLAGCRCGRAAAKPAPPAAPPISYRTICDNGVCRRVPIVAAGANAAAAVTVFVLPGNPASDAMRSALSGRANVSFVTGDPPPINGRRIWPTARAPNGAAWTPGGWDANSLSHFDTWLASETR